MNRETIIRLAREAGLANSWDLNWFDPAIERFATLVAAHERSRMCKQFNLDEELAHETATKDAPRD